MVNPPLLEKMCFWKTFGQLEMKSIKLLLLQLHHKCSLIATKKSLKVLIDGTKCKSQHPKIIVGKLSQLIFMIHRSLNSWLNNYLPSQISTELMFWDYLETLLPLIIFHLLVISLSTLQQEDSYKKKVSKKKISILMGFYLFLLHYLEILKFFLNYNIELEEEMMKSWLEVLLPMLEFWINWWKEK